MALTKTTIRTGAVRGQETETKGISSFLGIPYAKSTEGS